MKKNLLTIVALCSVMAVVAQSNSTPAANAVLISQQRNGDTIVSHYKIPHNDGKQAEFDMHYAINKTDITPSYSTNPQQIAELKDFMAQTKDTLMHIAAIHIVGYASPDGNAKQNDTLASKRAQSLYHYAVNTYQPKLPIDTKHQTFKWSECSTAVDKSSIPHKAQVLQILNSASHTESQKEAALRKMPDAWSYLATHILPQMRYADIEFDYGVDEIVTRTTLVSQPAPKPQQPPQPEEVIIDEEMGIIIATPKETPHHQHKKHKSGKSSNKTKGEFYEVIISGE